MPDEKPSANWATENVLKELEQKTPPGETASAQVFLSDTVSKDDLAAVARQIVDAAREAAGGSSLPVEIGKIHRLAKSFSVRAAPSVIRRMSHLEPVKAVLPSEIEEGVMIKPVKKKPVP